jgi:hypothetical protein
MCHYRHTIKNYNSVAHFDMHHQILNFCGTYGTNAPQNPCISVAH